MENLLQSLQSSMGQFFNQFAIFIPKLLGAIIIFVIGWIIAKMIKFVVKKVLKAINVDKLSDKVGLDEVLSKGDVKMKLSNLLSSMVYWMVMLVVIMTSLNSLDLTAIQGLFNQIILYIPNVFVAVIILILGMYAAKLASQAITGVLKNMEADQVQLVGKITYAAIMVFTVFTAIHQLQIAQHLIEIIFTMLMGALALATAIAFGIGGKDIAADLLKKLRK